VSTKSRRRREKGDKGSPRVDGCAIKCRDTGKGCSGSLGRRSLVCLPIPFLSRLPIRLPLGFSKGCHLQRRISQVTDYEEKKRLFFVPKYRKCLHFPFVTIELTSGRRPSSHAFPQRALFVKQELGAHVFLEISHWRCRRERTGPTSEGVEEGPTPPRPPPCERAREHSRSRKKRRSARERRRGASAAAGGGRSALRTIAVSPAHLVAPNPILSDPKGEFGEQTWLIRRRTTWLSHLFAQSIATRGRRRWRTLGILRLPSFAASRAQLLRQSAPSPLLRPQLGIGSFAAGESEVSGESNRLFNHGNICNQSFAHPPLNSLRLELSSLPGFWLPPKRNEYNETEAQRGCVQHSH